MVRMAAHRCGCRALRPGRLDTLPTPPRSPLGHSGRSGGACGRGFTLVELMIALIVVAVLASLALPAFLDAQRKSRRTDAYTALAAIQQAQERWRSSNPSYAAPTQLWNTAGNGVVPNGLVASGSVRQTYYSFAITSADAQEYEATATARAGTSQEGDGSCKVLGVRITRGGNIGYGAGASAAEINWSDPGRCWAR